MASGDIGPPTDPAELGVGLGVGLFVQVILTPLPQSLGEYLLDSSPQALT